MTATAKRREFSVAVKKAAKARAGDNCEASFCGMPFGGESPEYHHVKEDFYEGEPTLENCLVVHYRCHKLLTKAAAPAMAKVRRIEKKAAGIKSKGRSRFQTNRNGLYRQKLDGTVERR